MSKFAQFSVSVYIQYRRWNWKLWKQRFKYIKTTFECSLPTAIQKMLDVHLRDGVTRFFASGSFHDSSFPKSLKITLASFQFSLNCRYICKSRCTTVINDTSDKFAACVNYTGGKFATCTAGVIEPVANLALVAILSLLSMTTLVNLPGGK